LIILDSNVVSEVWRPRPSSSVLAWLDAQNRFDLYLCAPVLAELHFGAERLPAGRRRDSLRASINQLEVHAYRERILPFDVQAASAFGRVGAIREQVGKRMEPMDAMIAAIALTHGMKLATCDVGDFEGLGLDLINPFKAAVEE